MAFRTHDGHIIKSIDAVKACEYLAEISVEHDEYYATVVRDGVDISDEDGFQYALECGDAEIVPFEEVLGLEEGTRNYFGFDRIVSKIVEHYHSANFVIVNGIAYEHRCGGEGYEPSFDPCDLDDDDWPVAWENERSIQNFRDSRPNIERILDTPVFREI